MMILTILFFLLLLKVPDELKLDLLAQMKGDSEDHEVLTSVMFDAAMRIVDLVFSEV